MASRPSNCRPARPLPPTLAFACTLFPLALSLAALRHMSAFAAQLAINLEPVYAIVLAIALLGEQRELTAQFYAGVAIILARCSRTRCCRGRGGSRIRRPWPRPRRAT